MVANPMAYGPDPPAVPEWQNKGDSAWQLTAATLIGIQSMPGLVVLYGSIVKKKWAVNSAFMALYAFASCYIVWVLLAYRMAFGERLFPFWGKAGPSLTESFLDKQAELPSSAHYYSNGTLMIPMIRPAYSMALLVHFQFMYASIAVMFVAGSVLGRMSIKAWMSFAPLWLVFSYTIGAFSLWGGGFLDEWGVVDYSGGYVIHVSSGVAGFTAAYWVGPRLKSDRERFSPNNILLMIAGAGLLWLGWSGFNGGAPLAANVVASLAVLNTNIGSATSMLTWTCLDVIFFGKPSVIGAIQGMMTGLACITPAAGLVHGWAAMVMGILAGSIPWFSMMILHKKSALLQKVDDTLAVFHTHTVTGVLGGILTSLFAEPTLCAMILARGDAFGVFYGGSFEQVAKQVVAASFFVAWNVMTTTALLLAIQIFTPLRMPDEQLMVGDGAAHGEEAYALWGDGEKYDATKQMTVRPEEMAPAATEVRGTRGITIQL